MDGKTHLAAGIMTGIGVVCLKNKLDIDINALDSALFVAGCSLGSLLCDIDIDNSMLGRFIPGWLFWEHRTVTHSFFFMLVVGIIGVVIRINTGLNIGIIVGIATHLILDSLTPMGLPYLLFPFITTKPYKKRS